VTQRPNQANNSACRIINNTSFYLFIVNNNNHIVNSAKIVAAKII
jgi:hypothetical protein